VIASTVAGNAPCCVASGVGLDDFRAYMPQHSVPLFDANGVPILNDKGEQETMLATLWLDKYRPVETMTWVPGEPMLIEGKLISEGGWIDREGVTTFNLYRPPTLIPNNVGDATPWLDHVYRIYISDFDHIIQWLAHRVQRPGEKINHALVLGGLQGIGKDTLVEPVKRAVGPWNVSEVGPQHLLGRFNGFVKSVILRINEARDLGDVNRFAFYDHMKAYTAAPPDVLRVDEKNLREYCVPNCSGVIITTNHKTDGIFLPADDRRHYAAWSDAKKEEFTLDYWTSIYKWYDAGGDRCVAAYLAQYDLSRFDPKAPPSKTPTFWDIVDANRAPEDAELADVLDRLGNPNVTTLAKVYAEATGDFQEWLGDRRNRRQIPYRFERCEYVQVRNDAANDGLWVIHHKRQAIYAKVSLSIRDRIAAARELVDATRT
jgi:hypothetical protein